MDKLTEAHLSMLASWDVKDSICTGHAVDHATITREYMGRFAEWCAENGWEYFPYKKVFLNERGLALQSKSTSELIELFEKENV